MKLNVLTVRGIFFTLAAVLLINSCRDPLYDMSKGIDPEIKVGGDSLALPIGKTDTIRLSDFLSSDDLEFLKTMEDGGYGFTLSDSMSIEDLLKSLDKSQLKFADQIFSEHIKVSFGDIDVSEFKIPGFSIRDTLAMNIPNINIGDISPSVDIASNFGVDFASYIMDDNKLSIDDKTVDNRANDIVANVSPLDQYTMEVNPSFTFATTDPIDIGDLSVTVNYSIEVPDGVTNIYQIDLNAGAKMEITLQLDTAAESLSAGVFTPNIQIDPGNLFKFSPLTPLVGGNIVFDNSNSLHNFNDYQSSKSYDLVALHNLPGAVANIIDVAKLISISGTMDAEGTVMENKVQEAKKIDLVVNVIIKDVKINNLDFDVPSLKTSLSGSSSFSVNNNSLPSQVNKINKIYFGKTAGSPLSTNLVIQMTPSDLPTMKTQNINIDNMNITFPNNFTFSNLAGNTYAANNATFDPVNGFRIELNLSEIDLSGVDINAGVLDWSGNISYTGQVTFNGRMDSKNIDTSKNPNIAMTSASAIQLTSATVVTNPINEDIDAKDIDAKIDIDISDQVARLGTINVKPGNYVRVNINRPNLPLNLVANGISITFSDMFDFKPNPNLSNNSYVINGAIPDFIELELVALHINKDLNNGKLSLTEKISIGGGVTLQQGTVNSLDIENLAGSELVFEAIISDLMIESSSIEMKNLEAEFSDKTALDLVINDIPSEIVALDSILIKSGASLKLEIQINNMPDLGGKPLNADIKVKFPQMLQFGSGQVSATNELIIKEAFVNGKLARTVNLRSLKFDGSDLNGKLSIIDDIDFDVSVSVENPTINSADLDGKDISVDVKVTISGLEFAKVYGKFNVDISDQLDIPEVALDDLPDFLKGDDVVLDIANPVISLTTESNLGIPVSAELSMTKIIGGAPLADDKLTFTISIPKAATPAEMLKTGYWISPSSSGMPTGYQFIQRDVQNLFKPIPDKFKLELKPTINTNVQHLIDLNATYNMKVKYDFIIPFSFGKDLSIVVRDTIENISLDLGDVNINTGSMELLGRITNSIPLDLNLQLMIMDENFNILSVTDEQTILAGAPDGTGVVSNIAIKLADDFGDLKRMSKIALTFRATSNTTVAGTPIRPENYVVADLKARIGGGITVNINPNN